jgi:aspartate ammonia-lyase
VSYRVESDLLGSVQVPAEALYGAQTQRARLNFPLGQQRSVGAFPTLIRSLLWIKKAAALTNQEIGYLDARRAGAIVAAVEQLLGEPQPDQFPIHHLHGGGGTSANINADEVLANLGEELLGGRRGQYQELHPNDHVNQHQSTNDVYPSACRMAILLQWPQLERTLGGLADALGNKAAEYRNVPHLARTCLQDAVPINWYDFFRGQADFVVRRSQALSNSIDALHVINLGGSIVGRINDVPAAYLGAIVPNLCRVTGDPNYRQSANLVDAAQNADDLAAVSAQLDLLARGLVKIAKDYRLLASGPEAGIGEMRLPPVQPGSTCMPGKVNPVIPEFLIQTGFRVIGNHASCVVGLDHGELDLNVWESSMTFSVLESLELLQDGVTTFTERCVQGLSVDEAQNVRHAGSLIPLLTAKAEEIGYGKVTAICRQAGGDAAVIRELLRREETGRPTQSS